MLRWVVVVGLMASLPAPVAAARAGQSTIRPVAGCAELVRDLALPGTRAHVTRAEPVPEGDEPAHCAVLGYVEPEVRFQLKLPTTTYTGRYLQHGCGGFCGELVPPAFPEVGPEEVGPGEVGTDIGEFAVAATDDGHVGRGPVPGSTPRECGPTR